MVCQLKQFLQLIDRYSLVFELNTSKEFSYLLFTDFRNSSNANEIQKKSVILQNENQTSVDFMEKTEICNLLRGDVAE